MKKIGKWVLIALLIANGLFFMANIYVIGDVQAAIEMHDDLSPEATPFFTRLKVINVFVTGVLYLIAGIGLIKDKRKMIYTGIIGTICFITVYIFELLMWGSSHPRVWFDFFTFGTVSIILGISSFLLALKMRK